MAPPNGIKKKTFLLEKKNLLTSHLTMRDSYFQGNWAHVCIYSLQNKRATMSFLFAMSVFSFNPLFFRIYQTLRPSWKNEHSSNICFAKPKHAKKYVSRTKDNNDIRSSGEKFSKKNSPCGRHVSFHAKSNNKGDR